MYKYAPLSILVGLTIAKIEGLENNSQEVKITTTDGRQFSFYHVRDCCETVELIDYEAFKDKLIGGKIIEAEILNDSSKELMAKESYDFQNDSHTWSFYIINTDRGSIWMRWLGESNGYYSEEVDFAEIL
jgi:hypothetical protein